MESSDEKFGKPDHLLVSEEQSAEYNQQKETEADITPCDISVDSVGTTFVELSWRSPDNISKFHLTWSSKKSPTTKKAISGSKFKFSNLSPGTLYTFTIASVSDKEKLSQSAKISAYTSPNPPINIKVTRVDSTSVVLAWKAPNSSKMMYHVVCRHDGTVVQEKESTTTTFTVNNLIPDTKYSFQIFTVLESGSRSDSAEICAHTHIPTPSNVSVHSTGATFVELSWRSPDNISKFHLTWSSKKSSTTQKTISGSIFKFSDLSPGTLYTFTIASVSDKEKLSSRATTSAYTSPNPPKNIKVTHVDSTSVVLAWEAPNSSKMKYHVVCRHDGTVVQEKESKTTSISVNKLTPGAKYSFHIVTVLESGSRSDSAEICAHTPLYPPKNIKATHVDSTSVVLAWEAPNSSEMKYHVVCKHDGTIVQEKESTTTTIVVNDLTPGKNYVFEIITELGSESKSNPAEICAQTLTKLEKFLQDVGMMQHYTAKLSLSDLLLIDESTVTDSPAKSLSDLPWLLLKKLMMVNVTARSVKCAEDTSKGFLSLDMYSNLENLGQDMSNKVHPLDIITALFHCSDSFLQQELALKMSMCQFSVPLLLPHCDTQQSTLMAWALRDIVKKFRPHSLLDLKGFVEERIVLYDLPLVSFVRFGDCSISKSQILNKMLSNPQQYHDIFINYNMDCGDIPKTISDGLVEISWYLPCGSKNIDIFPKPVAVANLRGDIRMFKTQYSFLSKISTAVFVFFDNFDTDCQILNNNDKAQLFLVGNAKSKAFQLNGMIKAANDLNIKESNILLKTKPSDADFVEKLCSLVRNIVSNNPVTVQLEKMVEVAHELGILIDEDGEEIQKARKNAEAITNTIQDTVDFKGKQLPLQGEICKELAKLEKEECRLKKAGEKKIEHYKSEVQLEKQKLRERQRSYEMSEAMNCFIRALLNSKRSGRLYFLKWMRMNLDNLSRRKLSELRELYKEICQKSSENKERIASVDKNISRSSLGTEHFLREIGQLYEAAVSLPKNSKPRRQMLHLPKLCAELLMDGFPLELVDGDASNIPVRWVSAVLQQLNILVKPKNRIKVVTVLGVQSTGKSTLLNTMFGVQFAVSSGRCTRGAFMLLIKVSDKFREELNCDYLLIIDTEGLKSPELAQLVESYEHDNELATLVVGLSDITITNIAMENCAEMKDILQIVVHAFLRMKEVGKKPKCVFVHQNVADVSAHEKNMTDRKLLLDQLNEMTQAAAKMENKEEYKKFTDVMEYDPETCNFYIPGLWHGNPPMASVSTGYSEAVYDFKKNMMDILAHKKMHTNDITEFLEWTTSLWTAVKHENFIFNFRNSLVADAYMKLCTEYHKWEWSFKKQTYIWLTNAETKVSNFKIMQSESDKSNLKQLQSDLIQDASSKLTEWEKIILENLSKYFEQTEGHVNLVEKHRAEFENSAKSLRREMENSVKNEVVALIEIKTAKNKLDNIKKTYTDKMEMEVLHLLEDVRKNRSSNSMSEDQLNTVFDNMWMKTVNELSFKGLERRDIFDSVMKVLRLNMDKRGSSVSQMLNKVTLDTHGIKDFKVTPDDRVGKLVNLVYKTEYIKKLQELADSIIKACNQSVTNKKEKRSDYHDTYIQEIMHIIDENLTLGKDLKFSEKFEISLKSHICATSAREFQLMHECFLQENDPRRCLEQYKDKYCADFKDLFHNRDQCQRKAEEFTKLCLGPAVEKFINDKLGLDIIDTMLQGDNAFKFSTRAFFQYSILLELLEKEDFENYVSYIRSYEDFVKKWILSEIRNKFSEGLKLFELEEFHLEQAVKEINQAIKKTQDNTKEKGNIKEFIQAVCRELGGTLVIPHDALEAVMALNIANQEQFAHWLTQSVMEMEAPLVAKLKQEDIQSKLSKLRIKPQDELFKRVFGCGKQCPFCKAPCEAGGEAHTVHFTSAHRSEGLGTYRFVYSEKLVTDICSTSVNSESSFRCLETDDKYHPYKKYQEIFPDWRITADPSIDASNYWKYVLMHFNQQFAIKYKSKPADIPPAWNNITKEQAKMSLKESFSIK